MPTVFKSNVVEGDYYINEDGTRVVVPLVTAALRIETSDYTVVNGDGIILVDADAGDVDITLPSVALQNNYINIKKIDNSGNKVNILTPGSETIDGDTDVKITSQYESLQLVSDGSNWFVI